MITIHHKLLSKIENNIFFPTLLLNLFAKTDQLLNNIKLIIIK